MCRVGICCSSLLIIRVRINDLIQVLKEENICSLVQTLL